MVEEKLIEMFIKCAIEAELFNDSEEIKVLIKRRIIPMQTVRNFTICRMFDKALVANKNNITHTLDDLADDFGISEWQVRRIYNSNKRLFT